MSPPVLAVRALSAGYPDRPVLRDVSLAVAPGEVLAILGANGSGKSTLVRAALGLLPVTTGTISLFGTALPRFRQRHRIGYVPQRVGAGSGVPATVAEVVSSGRLARRRLRWLPRATDRAAVARAIAAVGLADRRRDLVGTLSGGQQQRTLIARALASEPDLLVLDEPTTGVDAASQLAFAATIRGFVAGGGAVVLVAHELGPLAELVSRSVVLDHGRVVPPGPGRTGDRAPDHVHPHAPAEPPGIWRGNHR
ncbi:MAG: ATP-binding cassette domain-containing protein [Micromonosporaceae bacterium]|nr:ATP-binding cassette domain-containing protein [Micromonosporaceae bacterium]